MFQKIYKDIMSLVLVVLALILITFFALYNSHKIKQESFFPNKADQKNIKDENFPVLDDNFYTNIILEGKGNSNSNNYVVVLSDYACPWSNKFFNETIKPFLNTSESKNVWLQYDFLALNESSPTLIASEASYCANEQNKFWEMHEKMFLLSTSFDSIEDAFSKENIYHVAKEIGLNQESFSQCLESLKYRQLIMTRANYYLGAFNVLGVPSTFVNGKPITLFIDGEDQMVGAIDLNTFSQKIKEMK